MSTNADPVFLTPAALLRHWQGHRRLTRRAIAAFPEDELFAFAPATPLRSFGAMMCEVVTMAEFTVRGLTTGEWPRIPYPEVADKARLLALWDEADRALAEGWPDVPVARLQDEDATVAIGLPPQPNIDFVLYQIDNEVHHRAQGFIYLRILGLEPPPFHER